MDDAKIHYAKSKQDIDAQTSSKFKYDECIDWQQSFIAYLTSNKSVTPSASISVNCVIRTDLVALVLFGDVPKWSGQGHFEDTSGTRPGHVRPGTHF